MGREGTRRARWGRRLRRSGATVVALVLVGAGYERVGAWRDLRRFPAQGARVDLGGGRAIHLDCRGAGSPTVLLEAGFRGWSPAWTAVQPEVAAFTRVCSYDRAGLGLSDTGPRPRTVEAVNADLARALERAQIAPPYVLVGHSAGGMYQRRFLVAHPEQVTGLVLVDTDVPTDDADRRAVATGDDDRTTGRILTALSYTGVFRLLFRTLEMRIGSAESERYPEEAKVRFSATMTRLGAAMPDEWTLYQSAYASMTTASLGDLPLVVIAALGYRPDPADRADWIARQTSLARLSTRGRLIVREDQSHYLPLVEPETVTNAIHEVVTASRAAPE